MARPVKELENISRTIFSVSFLMFLSRLLMFLDARAFFFECRVTIKDQAAYASFFLSCRFFFRKCANILLNRIQNLYVSSFFFLAFEKFYHISF